VLITIPLLTAVIFAAVYPLCFWISFRDPIKNDFHKFHLTLPNCVGGVAVLGLLFSDVPFSIKVAALIWKAIFLSLSNYFWKKGSVNPLLMTIPCVLGITVFSMLQNHLITLPLSRHQLMPFFKVQQINNIGILAGFILCASIFSMNLGHWYLNVHGLPVSHLLRAVYVFGFLLIVRMIWDAYCLMTLNVIWNGEPVPILFFMQHIEGFFLWIAIFFGTLFPLISLYFVRGTLLVKSTQSATGILYVILSAVLLGDIAYKYYLMSYGLAL
jgi:hypothetical protein